MTVKSKNEEPEDALDEEIEEETEESGDDDKEVEEESEQKEKVASDGKSLAGKTFSQKQVSRMMANEKRQGKASVYNALGIDPDDADTINAVKALVAERGAARKSGAVVNDVDDAELTEMQERAILAEAKVDAMVLGCSPRYVEDVVTLALAKSADSGSDLKTVFGEIKTKYPDWFNGADEDGDEGKSGKKSKGTGSSVKKAQKRAKDADDDQNLGVRLAAQRTAKTGDKKKSYWS